MKKKTFWLVMITILFVGIGLVLSYVSSTNERVISGSGLWDIRIKYNHAIIIEGQADTVFLVRAYSEDMFYIRSRNQIITSEAKCFKDEQVPCYFESRFSVSSGDRYEVNYDGGYEVRFTIESGEVNRIIVVKTAEGIRNSNVLIGMELLICYVLSYVLIVKSIKE